MSFSDNLRLMESLRKVVLFPFRHAYKGVRIIILIIGVSFIVILTMPNRQAYSTGLSIPQDLRQASSDKVIKSLGMLSLSFEANKGQLPSSVKFISRGFGNTLVFSRDKVVFRIPSLTTEVYGPRVKSDSNCRKYEKVKMSPCTRLASGPQKQIELTMQLVDRKRTGKVESLNKLPGTINYFIGHNPKNWHTNIPTYQKVVYRNVYPGIDQLFYGNESNLEFDFIVAPGADPRAIALKFTGQANARIDEHGDLVLNTKAATPVIMHKPNVYQNKNGVRHQVWAEYVIKGNGNVQFKMGVYDRGEPLIIDPIISYSTFLGGTGNDSAFGIATDGDGNTYVTGTTDSSQFSALGGTNVFVTKLNSNGTQQSYVAILGGESEEEALDITVANDGSAYITGSTSSEDFPKVNASQPNFGGLQDAFVAKLNPTGSAITYSTYIGGSGQDGGFGVALDNSGNAYVTGSTNSPQFSALPGSNAFVAKFSAIGNERLYLSILGGDGDDIGFGIDVSQDGSVSVTGATDSVNFTTANATQPEIGGLEDAFVAKLNPAGSGLVYSTYLGGSGSDTGSDLALDSEGYAYVVGSTSSPELSTLEGTNVFVTKLNPSGGERSYFAVLGGSGDDIGYSIALDGGNNAYITGSSDSTNFTTVSPLQTNLGGLQDAFVAKLNPLGSSLIYSTFLGGVGNDSGFGIAVDNVGAAYAAGFTNSANFVSESPYGGSGDAFVAKISDPAGHAQFDYDGDGKSDISVFRPANGGWFIQRSTAGIYGVVLGDANDKIAPADYDGDGKTDVAIYRPSEGNWYVLNSSNGLLTTQHFGLAADIPVAGDFDGDGKADVNLFRNSDSTWYHLNSTNGAFVANQFGLNGDKPQAGDFDGDGKADIAVFRPSNGVWYWINSGSGTISISSWGLSTDLPVPADYEGDGKTDMAIYRPSQGSWYILKSSDGGFMGQAFGLASDIPAPGDFDGDGKADVAIFRPSDGMWWINRSTAGVLAFPFGTNGDKPTLNAYVY